MTNDNIKYINKSSKERMVRELLEKKGEDYGNLVTTLMWLLNLFKGFWRLLISNT